jgi:hypothetical protein
MSRWFRATPALLISVAALIAAGCGSSSKSKTTVTSPAASTPATPSTPSTPTTPVHAYPAVLRSGYLKSCEAKGSAAKCECTLSYLEAHVSLPQFIKESQEIQRTHKPSASILNAARACKNK